MLLDKIEVKASRRAIDKFKVAARACFPNETYGLLIGEEHAKGADVHHVWFPEYIISDPGQCLVDSHWIVEASEWAKEEHDMVVVGDIHSHPFRINEKSANSNKPDLSQSEADMDLWPQWQTLRAICRVVEYSNARLRCSVRFWGPVPQIKVKII